MVRRKFAIFIIAAFAASVIGLELSLRYFAGLGHPVLFTQDDDFGYIPKSSQNLQRFGSWIAINHQGMRSDEFSDDKPKYEKRILFVGDSVPFGTTYVDQGDIFTNLIQRGLDEKSSGQFKILNAAAPGWAPANEMQYLKKRGTSSAEMVVFVYNTKDLIQKFSPFVSSPIMPTTNPKLALIELWQRYLSPRIGLSSQIVDPGSTGDEGGPDFNAEDEVMRATKNAKLIAERSASTFVILYVPSNTREILINKKSWDILRDRLQKWAILNHVDMIDASYDLETMPESEIYFDGMHLRPKGNILVADAFLRWFTTRQ